MGRKWRCRGEGMGGFRWHCLTRRCVLDSPESHGCQKQSTVGGTAGLHSVTRLHASDLQVRRVGQPGVGARLDNLRSHSQLDGLPRTGWLRTRCSFWMDS